MIMTFEERKEFLKTHLTLLFFVGRKKHVISDKTTFEKFLNTDTQVKFNCREEMYNDDNIIDEYLASNFDHLNDNEIDIINGLKKRVNGDFIILRCLQKHAIFIDPNSENVYAVAAISDSFTYFFEYFPVLIHCTIIPFKNRIIYDGFFQSENIRFGAGIKDSLNEIYRNAKQHKTIISSLV